LSFRRGSDGVWRCVPLEELPWLDHGFGSRHGEGWLQGRRVATLHQTHSDKVRDAAGQSGWLGEGDALVSREPGLMVAVRTADCFPVVLADPVKQAVAVVHAGWRGVLSRIAVKAVERLVSRYGSDSRDLRVAIGPGIGICCFEVGPEVARQFQMKGRVRVDLAGHLAQQLVESGAVAKNIHQIGLCSFCQPDDFWSFRRDGEAAGRMWSAAGVRIRY
jgi:hypothetical protein